MSDLASKNFGILIAYVLPGFASLWMLQPYSATLRAWLSASPSLPAGIEAVAFVTAASIAAGMAQSAVRWVFIDNAMRWSGLIRPQWNDLLFGANKDAFEALVDAHFRYYQFYAHMALVLPLLAVHPAVTHPQVQPAVVLGVLAAAEGIFLLAAHNALSQYYLRTSRLLSSTDQKGQFIMTNGHHKPVQQKPKGSAKSEGLPKPIPSQPKTDTKGS